MILSEEEYLEHYGTPRHSGRYPWGSGSPESTRHRDFLDSVESLRAKGLSEAKIAEGMGLKSTTELRAKKTIALNVKKQEQIQMIERLAAKGLSNVKIGERMGLNESSVRALRAPGQKDKLDVLNATSDMLKRQVAEKRYIDIGSNVEKTLPLGNNPNAKIGISADKFKTAVALLVEQGYTKHYVQIPQLTGSGSNKTTIKVLAAPGVGYSEVFRNRGQIQQIGEASTDGGRHYDDLIKPPTSISSRRVGITYGPEGGDKADGVIYVRPGVKDLSLGSSSYAQVRIAVDGTHYLKGMAVYKEGLPEGKDLVFNTNKSDTGRKKDAMKELTDDKDNPFGAMISRQSGHMNIIYEEGDWDKWSKNLSSQMLSKQSPALAKKQLDVTYERRQKEFDEINKLTNPTVKEKLLTSFADETDSAAVHLKAAALPSQATKVLLPLTTIKPNEAYVPSLPNGTPVALVRFPHGGPFEIPKLIVNNRNPEAKKLFGSSAVDAIGIHQDVAHRLSGADFDGDHVLVIPNKRGEVKNAPALEGLKDFDPQIYKIPNGPDGKPVIPHITASGKGHEMGKITNLIADMTIRGANNDELARAVRHSMVVIDSEKHGLDYKASARANGIPALKSKYQFGSRAGASTLITKAGASTYINERKLRRASKGGPVDKVTGKKVYEDTGKMVPERKSVTGPDGRKIRINTDKLVPKQMEVERLAVTDDAHTLSSGTDIENLYANHSNRLKGLANQARKEAVTTVSIPYSKSAKAIYSTEVGSLEAKLNVALKNAPYERQAQVIASAAVALKRQANPNMDTETLKKIKNQAIAAARARTGANKQQIEITQAEWDAIQAGAISTHKLKQILTNTNLDNIKQLATPRIQPKMTVVMRLRAQSMLDNGFTQAEVASQLGVSLSTLKTSISEGQ